MDPGEAEELQFTACRSLHCAPAHPRMCMPAHRRGHQKRVQQPGEGGGDDASPASCIQDRGYASQAAGITRELEDVSKYKSLALFAEVKLSEALEACAKACPDVHEADGALIPNKLRTAVCCQVRCWALVVCLHRLMPAVARCSLLKVLPLAARPSLTTPCPPIFLPPLRTCSCLGSLLLFAAPLQTC